MTGAHPSVPGNAMPGIKSRTARQRGVPETIRQAHTWETVKRQVLRAGLCEKCAAQYAWGCQIGFTLSHPPCGACTEVVAQHGGRERPNGWRTLHTVKGFGTWRGP